MTIFKIFYGSLYANSVWNVLVDLSPFNSTLRPGFTENPYEIDFDHEGSPPRVLRATSTH